MSAHGITVLEAPEFASWCRSPLPEVHDDCNPARSARGSENVFELFPKAAAPEQLELVSIARDLQRRYAGAMREIVLELNRDQVGAIANAVQAHRLGEDFYSKLGPTIEVMEEIVRQWCRFRKESHGANAK